MCGSAQKMFITNLIFGERIFVSFVTKNRTPSRRRPPSSARARRLTERPRPRSKLMWTAKSACWPQRALLLSCTALATTLVISQRSTSKETEPLTVYYFAHDWCEAFHFGAVMRMCRAATNSPVTCNLVSDMTIIKTLVGSKTGTGENFGLPVVEHGSIRISQSVAGTVFAGELLGRGASVPSVPKAIQYMLDMRDLIDNLGMGNAGYDGTTAGPSTAASTIAKFDAEVACGRVGQFLAYFERNIAGPYFFRGSTPSYVDYYFASMLAWVRYQLETAGGSADKLDELLSEYPRLSAVLKAV